MSRENRFLDFMNKLKTEFQLLESETTDIIDL